MARLGNHLSCKHGDLGWDPWNLTTVPMMAHACNSSSGWTEKELDPWSLQPHSLVELINPRFSERLSQNIRWRENKDDTVHAHMCTHTNMITHTYT